MDPRTRAGGRARPGGHGPERRTCRPGDPRRGGERHSGAGAVTPRWRFSVRRRAGVRARSARDAASPRAGAAGRAGSGPLTAFDVEALIAFLAAGRYGAWRRLTAELPRSMCSRRRSDRRTQAQADGVRCRLELADPGDRELALARLPPSARPDNDSRSHEAQFGRDPCSGRSSATAGLRVPSTVDGFELAVRAIVGSRSRCGRTERCWAA